MISRRPIYFISYMASRIVDVALIHLLLILLLLFPGLGIVPPEWRSPDWIEVTLTD